MMEKILIGAFLLYLFATNQREKLSFSAKGGGVSRWDFDGVTVWVDVTIHNGTVIPIPIEGFEGDIIRSGVLLAKSAMISPPVTIHSKQDKVIRIGAKILYSGVAGEVFAAIQSGEVSRVVTMDGYVYGAGKKIPVKFDYELW